MNGLKRKNKISFSPFPILKTERLSLRKIEESDCDTILFLRSDKVINEFIYRPESSRTKNKADAHLFIQKIHSGIRRNQFISWGITLHKDPKIIGTICLWNFSKDLRTAEVGYDLNPIYQGKGIMTEALNKVIHFGQNELNFNKIEAFTHKENEASKKLLEKCGLALNTDRVDLDNLNNLIFETTQI